MATPYYHSPLKPKVLKTTFKTKNIKIIILPKILCIYMNQISINTVYNYVKNSNKSQKFIDSIKIMAAISVLYTKILVPENSKDNRKGKRRKYKDMVGD